jgi:DNA polymerase
MLIGEMPGDEEDRAGKPFVGPAGRLLDEMLHDAGISRDDTFVTNAVKHFRWQQRGKRRLHKKPTTRQIEACKPWLHAEIAVVRPTLVVCLGATASQSLLGQGFRLTQQRGRIWNTPTVGAVLPTYHPASVLRAPKEDRERNRRELVADLTTAAKLLDSSLP